MIVVVKCWKRYEIFEIFAQSIKKLGVDVYCGISEDKYKEICDRHGFHYFEVPNDTLGLKINLFYQKLKVVDFDYVLILNSNNVMSDNFLQPYIEAMEKGIDFAGFMDSYFCFDNQLKYWAGYEKSEAKYKDIRNRDTEPAGHGRLVSRRLIEKMGWLLVNNRDMGNTDKHLFENIQKIEHTEYFFTLREKGIMHCGIKDNNNMHKFEDIEGKLIDINLLYNQLPNEAKMIKELWTE